GNDGINFRRVHNSIVDHCSVSWGVDENIECIWRCNNVTIQWCISSEALHKSTNRKGAHSKGLMVGYHTTNVTLHHNLIAHCVDRNPYLPADHDYPNIIDVVNNVVYNWWVRAGIAYPKTNRSGTVNFVGNYYIMGPDSWKKPCLTLGVDTRVYAQGNIGACRVCESQDEYDAIVWTGPQERDSLKYPFRFDAPKVATQHYIDAYESIIDNAGATLPRRDSHDHRIIQEVENRRGKIISHPSEVNGWPLLRSAAPPRDTDNDGMPDDWETANGLDPKNADDAGGDTDRDGYTNIEEWLNSIAANPFQSQTIKKIAGDGSENNPVKIPKRTRKISVDGYVDEWDSVPSMPLPLQHRDTSSFYFAWSKDGLYGAAVIDDSVLHLYDGDPYLGDCIELFIDRNVTTTKDTIYDDAVQVMFLPTLDMIAGSCLVHIPYKWNSRDKELLQSAWNWHEKGYTIEFFLPAEFLRPAMMKKGVKFRLNFNRTQDGKPEEQFFAENHEVCFLPKHWGLCELE
ncbi:MAG: hypothetical protein GF350_16925, partial [Chitinivibrionales bacterium]|nr:hypothetical protein [Chitinivibrionales bacterium]